MKSKATLPQLKYDNCKDCASKCEHAGKNREFVYSGERSCKVNGITRKIDREKWAAEWIYPENEFSLPRCSKCGCNSKDAQYGHKDNFCPKCGRAMTPEAWAELERRLIG